MPAIIPAGRSKSGPPAVGPLGVARSTGGPSVGPRTAGSAPVDSLGLYWLSATNTYLPSDSYDAASTYAVALATATGLPLAGGSLTILPFTLAGGAPIVGQTVWMASSQDDGLDLSRGFATATLPVIAVPAFNVYCKNIVPIGVCTNATNLGTALAPRYTVQMLPSVNPGAPAVSNSSMSFNRINFPSGGSLTADGTPAQMQLSNNQSIVIYCSIDDVNSTVTGNFRVANFSGTTNRGWGFLSQNNGAASFKLWNASVSLSGPGPSPNPGLHRVAITRTGGNIRMSVDGAAAYFFADTNLDPGANAVFTIDYGGYISFLGCAKLNRVMLDAELQTVSTVADWTPTVNNYSVAASPLVTDVTCQWYLDVTSYTSGAINSVAGPAGTGFPWAQVGIITVRTCTLNWIRNPQSLYLDGPPVVKDTKGLSRTRAFQRIAFDVPTAFDLAVIVAGMSCDDADNSDEGGEYILMRPSGGTTQNQNALLAIQAPTSGLTQYINGAYIHSSGDPYGEWLATLLAAGGPYRCEIYTSDKESRFDTFMSGQTLESLAVPSTATFVTASVTRRLITVSDGTAQGGHNDDLIGTAISTGSAPSGSPIRRMRDTYPGDVHAFFVSAQQSVGRLEAWGAGAMQPAAQLIVDMAAPALTRRDYLFHVGFNDWRDGVLTPTQTATKLLALSDAVHTRDPGGHYYWAVPIQTLLYTSVRAGFTLQNFVDAITAAVPAYATLIDLTGPNAIAFNVGSGNIAPTAMPSGSGGQWAVAANVKARIGW